MVAKWGTPKKYLKKTIYCTYTLQFHCKLVSPECQLVKNFHKFFQNLNISKNAIFGQSFPFLAKILLDGGGQV
jgi:hypothetical protein